MQNLVHECGDDDGNENDYYYLTFYSAIWS